MSTVAARVDEFEEEPTVILSRGRALWHVIKRKPLGAASAAGNATRAKTQRTHGASAAS